MELYETTGSAEKRLQDYCDIRRVPLGGNMELLPLCNMDCKMCYIRKSKAEMDAEGKMLSADEWLQIAEQAKEAGTLFLLLTGGEPLIYPEFKRLYTSLIDLGFILTINTNATLIDEEWADFFAKHPCRRLSITLYGKDDATYERLCGNPKGFTQVMHAANMLKERNVPFRFTCSITGDNRDDLEELFAIARRLDVPLQPAAYMFPGSRRGIDAQHQVRLSAEEAAKMMFKTHLIQKTEEEMKTAIGNTMKLLFKPPKLKNLQLYTCHAGLSGFWMNWKGEMLPCGMQNSPKKSLKENSFKDAWAYIVDEASKVRYSEECKACKLQNICSVCPASLLAEVGATDKRPDYVCRYTKELLRLQIEYMSKDNRELYEAIVNGLGL